MSYIKQSFQAMDTYVNSYINQHEINIRDHLHDKMVEDDVEVSQISRNYAGLWKTNISPNSTTIAHKLDTQTFINASSTAIFTLCNSGTIKFTLGDYGLRTSKFRGYGTTDPGASPANIYLTTTEFDTLNEWESSTTFVPKNSGLYAFFLNMKKALGTANAYWPTLQFWNNYSSYALAEAKTKLNSAGIAESCILQGQALLEANIGYTFRVSSYTNNFFISAVYGYIYRVL